MDTTLINRVAFLHERVNYNHQALAGAESRREGQALHYKLDNSMVGFAPIADVRATIVAARAELRSYAEQLGVSAAGGYFGGTLVIRDVVGDLVAKMELDEQLINTYRRDEGCSDNPPSPELTRARVLMAVVQSA